MNISVEDASISDAELVYSIRNEKKVRMNSWNICFIDYEDHLKFFEKNHHQYKIIRHNNQKIGFIRITKDNNVSIGLYQGYRGRGIGSMVLKDLFGCASIKINNVESFYAFLKAGWKPVGWIMEKEE